MKVKIREVGDVAILDLNGKLMGAPEDVEIYKNDINGMIEKGYKKVLINLEGVTFVNSTGLGMIVSGFTSAKSKGCDMRLTNMAERVISLFTLTKLSTVFKTYATEEAALADFK